LRDKYGEDVNQSKNGYSAPHTTERLWLMTRAFLFFL